MGGACAEFFAKKRKPSLGHPTTCLAWAGTFEYTVSSEPHRSMQLKKKSLRKLSFGSDMNLQVTDSKLLFLFQPELSNILASSTGLSII